VPPEEEKSGRKDGDDSPDATNPMMSRLDVTGKDEGPAMLVDVTGKDEGPVMSADVSNRGPLWSSAPSSSALTLLSICVDWADTLLGSKEWVPRGWVPGIKFCILR
jgi:hypothetical protein